MTKTTVPYTMLSKDRMQPSVMKKCFFCVPLRIACYILAYLSVTGSGFAVANLFLDIVTWIAYQIWKWPESYINNKHRFVFEILNLLALQAIYVIWMVVSVHCLVGIYKRKPGHMRPFITFHIGLALYVFLSWCHDLVVRAPNFKVEYLVDLFYVIGLIYLIAVFYSHMVEIERKIQRRQALQSSINKAFTYVEKNTDSGNETKEPMEKEMDNFRENIV